MGVDDLPVIRDNIKKGFLETQSTVNKWVNSLKKKIDGEDEDNFSQPPKQGYQPQQNYGGRGSNELGRRSADRERYDADPQVLGDDFAGLSMKDNEGKFHACLTTIQAAKGFPHQPHHRDAPVAPSKPGSLQAYASPPSIHSVRSTSLVPRWPTRGNRHPLS